MELEFEWDERKNTVNIRDRGIDFRDAARAFECPMITTIDTRKEYGEKRWFGLCELEGVIIVIVYTMRGHKIRIISMRRASRMNAKSTKKILNSRTDWAKLRQEQENDSPINYGDVPETSKEFWKNAKIYMPQHKVHVSMRLDDEIVNFFKQGGRGYQSKINAVLKAYVQAHTDDKRR